MEMNPLPILNIALLKRVRLFNKYLSAIGFVCLIGFISAPSLLAQSLPTGGGMSFSSYAVTAEGKLYAWGANFRGQLGNSTKVNSATPLDISPFGDLAGKTIVSVSSGYEHTLALASDGTVYAWGNGLYGQLGRNAFESTVPLQVPGLSGITAIAAGGNHSLALKSDGTVYAWGDGQNGQLGDGNFYGPPPFRVVVPVQVTNLSGVTAIAAGYSHSVALKSDGTVYAWGSGTSGQMGNGSFNSSAVPVPVSGLSRIKTIAAGRGHSLALHSDGIVYAWGLGISGQLGSGGYNSVSLRVQVINLSGITAIAAGNLHSLALKSDGTIYAWGNGQNGQLGNGNFNNSAVPVQVSSLSNITHISGGEGHSLARKSDGIIYAW